MAENSPTWLARVRQFVANPVFVDDEKTRIARLLNIILLVILIAVFIAAVVTMIAGLSDAASLAMEGAVFVVALSLLLVMRRGHIRTAALALCVTLWIIITAGVWTTGGLLGSGATAYFGIVLIAGLLLGGWAGVAFGALSFAATAIMLYAEQIGRLPPIPAYITSIYTWIEFAATMTGITGLLLLATNSLRQALDRARSDERAVAEQNRELMATREALERQTAQLQTTVQHYVDYMTKVGQGDLTTRLDMAPAGDGDEALHVLGSNLNDAVAGMERMIGEIHSAAGNLSAASVQILATTTQQAASASEQSAAIAQTTATVDEVRAIAEQSVERAQDVAGAAERTVQISRSGQQSAEHTISSMERIQVQVEAIAANILTLSAHTQQIGDIIAAVGDLASQSNLLALNAAVEAARAGEHGRGFAIVAAEVRSLAEQSRAATARVRELLHDIQQATNATVMATEEGTKRAGEGVRLAAQTGEAIRHLAGVIDESAQSAIQMAASGRQQAAGIEQIAAAMRAIHQATVQSLASTRQAEQSAKDLSELASRLNEAVARYRLRQDTS